MQQLLTFIVAIYLVFFNTVSGECCCSHATNSATVQKVEPACPHCQKETPRQEETPQPAGSKKPNSCPCHQCPKEINKSITQDAKIDTSRQMNSSSLCLADSNSISSPVGSSFNRVEAISAWKVASSVPLRILHSLFLC